MSKREPTEFEIGVVRWTIATHILTVAAVIRDLTESGKVLTAKEILDMLLEIAVSAADGTAPAMEGIVSIATSAVDRASGGGPVSKLN